MKTEREILDQIEKIENNIKISENKVKYWQSRKDSFMIDLENVRLTQYTSHISSLKMGTRK